MFSARPCAKASPSACSTLETPAICAAAVATAAALEPATSTWTSPPHWRAAVTVLKVAPLRVALSCSAITNDDIFCSKKLFNQLGTELVHCPEIGRGRFRIELRSVPQGFILLLL